MQELIELAKGQGFPVLLLIIAIAWMQRVNNELINRLNEERKEHLNRLESEIAECSSDRKELWAKLLEHTQKV